MKNSKDIVEIINGIKNIIPEFDNEKMITYAKWCITNLYNSIKNNENIKINCNEDLINKLKISKPKFKIKNDIDHLSIQYLDLYDYEVKDNFIYIKVYASVYFYDNQKNNGTNSNGEEKYWNDIWVATFKENLNFITKSNSSCSHCGSLMKYNPIRDIYECDYCGNMIHNNYNAFLELLDIDILEQ